MLIAALLLEGWNGRALAQDSVPVLVDVRFAVPEMDRAWGDQRKEEIRATIRTALIKDLAAVFPYYEFGEAVAAPKRMLVFRVVASDSTAANVELQALRRSGQPDQVWSASWLNPGDVLSQGYPAAARAADVILQAFRKNFVEQHQLHLDEWLWTHVPIAKGGRWVDQSPTPTSLEIALPLPFARFGILEQSVFLIECKGLGNRSETLESNATGGRVKFPTTAPSEAYEALVVLPRFHNFAGARTEIDQDEAARVRALTLDLVYVKQYVPSAGLDADLNPDDTH